MQKQENYEYGFTSYLKLWGPSKVRVGGDTFSLAPLKIKTHKQQQQQQNKTRHFPLIPKIKILIFYFPVSQKLPLFPRSLYVLDFYSIVPLK